MHGTKVHSVPYSVHCYHGMHNGKGKQPMMGMSHSISTVAFLRKRELYMGISSACLNHAMRLSSVSLSSAEVSYRQARRQSFNNACKDVASSTHW